MQNPIVEKIIKEIEHFAPKAEAIHVGRVTAVGDGVVAIDGLSKAVMSEIVQFEETAQKTLSKAMDVSGSLYGLVLNLEEDGVRAIVLGDSARVAEGMTVKSSGRILSVPSGEELLGRVVNALGEPVDGKGPFSNMTMMPVEREASGVIDRRSVSVPLQTGIKAIDSMIPIGRGQRELLIGDRSTGKTTIAIDTIINQRNEPEGTRPICIYVAIGQKESKTARRAAPLDARPTRATFSICTRVSLSARRASLKRKAAEASRRSPSSRRRKATCPPTSRPTSFPSPTVRYSSWRNSSTRACVPL